MELVADQVQQERGLRRRRRLNIWGRLLYRAARRAQRRRAARRPWEVQRTTTENAYGTWRHGDLRKQLLENFDVSQIAGQDVLDFGCGTGELCTVLAEHHPKSLVGVDMSPDAIRRARQAIDSNPPQNGALPRFICNTRHDVIPLARSSVDLICCFDAVEHIPSMRSIAAQWRRMLRPGGRVWVWWSPWRGPYGHHLESLMPIPWVHLLLSEETLFAACAELYDDQDFVPRKWDRDPVTGDKRPNKWRKARSFYPFLNRLTRPAFERHIERAGLVTRRRKTAGFSGSPWSKATRVLVPVPLVGQCFVSYYVYELARS